MFFHKEIENKIKECIKMHLYRGVSFTFNPSKKHVWSREFKKHSIDCYNSKIEESNRLDSLVYSYAPPMYTGRYGEIFESPINFSKKFTKSFINFLKKEKLSLKIEYTEKETWFSLIDKDTIVLKTESLKTCIEPYFTFDDVFTDFVDKDFSSIVETLREGITTVSDYYGESFILDKVSIQEAEETYLEHIEKAEKRGYERALINLTK